MSRPGWLRGHPLSQERPVVLFLKDKPDPRMDTVWQVLLSLAIIFAIDDTLPYWARLVLGMIVIVICTLRRNG